LPRAPFTSEQATKTRRVLVIAPHSSYRTAAYIQAAQSLKSEVLIASEGEYSIVSDFARGLHIHFAEPDIAFQTIIEAAKDKPFSGVIGTDDSSLELAARVARYFNLPHNTPLSVRLAGRKDLARKCLQQARVAIPGFREMDLTKDIKAQVNGLGYPVVVKPVALSGSRGVIRANDYQELLAATTRIKKLLDKEQQLDIELRQKILVEQYIPGDEVAVEGMLRQGQLDILTIFDKPDPLEGPFFEESYYITPSRHSAKIQQQLHAVVQQACKAYSLKEGPVHAECRINNQGVWTLEVAARTIGGLCARLLTFGTGHTLEQLVLAQAMGEPLITEEQRPASGVLMIPITQAGIFKRVEGLLEAQRVPDIIDIDIQIREGYELVPLPEGASYLGFIFASADTAEKVEAALRKAHACLKIVVAPMFKVNIA
jgi:biotin carboxylase